MAALLEIAVMGISKWEGWLVGYFVEQKLSFCFFKNYIDANVKSLGKVELLSSRQDCFMIKLKMSL